MQQPGLCLWRGLGSDLSPRCLWKALLRAVKTSSATMVLAPATALEALVQSWCQWEEGGRQDPCFLRWQIHEAFAVSPSCEEIRTSSDHSGSWESLHKGNKPAAAKPFSERHQCPQGENIRSAPGGRFPQTRNLLQFWLSLHCPDI